MPTLAEMFMTVRIAEVDPTLTDPEEFAENMMEIVNDDFRRNGHVNRVEVIAAGWS